MHSSIREETYMKLNRTMMMMMRMFNNQWGLLVG